MAEEFIRGDPEDSNNLFRWDILVLNLPGSSTYAPDKPWVSKIKLPESKIACNLFIYLYDVRITGDSYLECQRVSRIVASLFNYFGLQDAARERRDPRQSPSQWAGSIVATNGPSVEIMVSQELWDKAKAIVQ